MNKNVIVTGGSRGIGEAIVRTLAEAGCNVVLNYNKSEEKAKLIQEELKNKGYNVEIFQADVSIREQCKALVEFGIKAFGHIDVLVNNAGIAQYKLFTDITDEDWDRMLKVNLNSVFYMSQEILHHMIERQSGSIINISSVWAMVGAACEVHYSASKAAVDGLTKGLAKELGKSNIRVNSVAPGAIDTDMNSDLTEDELKDLEEETPLSRIGKPIDIAKCVKWLVEDEFTTGQVISPNGGWIIV